MFFNCISLFPQLDPISMDGETSLRLVNISGVDHGSYEIEVRAGTLTDMISLYLLVLGKYASTGKCRIEGTKGKRTCWKEEEKGTNEDEWELTWPKLARVNSHLLFIDHKLFVALSILCGQILSKEGACYSILWTGTSTHQFNRPLTLYSVLITIFLHGYIVKD